MNLSPPVRRHTQVRHVGKSPSKPQWCCHHLFSNPNDKNKTQDVAPLLTHYCNMTCGLTHKRWPKWCASYLDSFGFSTPLTSLQRVRVYIQVIDTELLCRRAERGDEAVTGDDASNTCEAVALLRQLVNTPTTCKRRGKPGGNLLSETFHHFK